jgi:hypothetical protein
MKILWRGLSIWISACLFLTGCGEGPGSAGGKVFLALGICLAAVFLVFYIVVKGQGKD